MRSATRVRSMRDGEIRERIDTLSQAIRAKDARAVLAHYTPDVVAYDVMPPLEAHGADEYRRNFERWFASMQGPIEFDTSELRISMSESHAFCHCLGHVRGTRVEGERVDYSVRITNCFQKVNGQWLIVHEHVSVPKAL